ncbi:hypothetical protein TrCOL_g13646 [Triparma columacea]|uniref:Pyridoxamine 5'-phosphate oxidase Alr4036 family FMN-binding domain-containing protein n=1 Tax=Triparma columacea TaxID=722753 RepID=A0A9W7G1B0_9STRA|nr:hypothetical protein TrCOL_g13646 [Triparma columacea]
MSSLASTASPWRQTIAKSIKKSRKIRGGNYVQLATVDKQGDELIPRVRTVVFRGFVDTDSDCYLKFCTDSRSHKFAQVNTVSDNAEVVWWFSQSSEQFRFTGKLSFVGAESTDEHLMKLRRDLWKSMREEAQDQFFWVGPPGDERPSDQENVVERLEDPEAIPENFLLMLVKPTSIDYLALKTNYREKHILSSESNIWETSRLNP